MEVSCEKCNGDYFKIVSSVPVEKVVRFGKTKIKKVSTYDICPACLGIEAQPNEQKEEKNKDSAVETPQ